MRKLAKSLVVVAALLTAACSVTSSATRYTSAPQLPAAAPGDVVLHTGLLDRDLTELGEVRVQWSGTRLEYGLLEDPEIQSALKSEAAKLGANAVMVLRPITAPGGERSRVAGRRDTPLIKGVAGTAVRIH